MGIAQAHVQELVSCMFVWVLNSVVKTAVMEDLIVLQFGMEILLLVLMVVGDGSSDN